MTGPSAQNGSQGQSLLTWRRAMQSRAQWMRRQAGTAVARYIRQERARRATAWVLLLAFVGLNIAGYIIWRQHPNADASQDRKIAQLKQQLAALQAPAYPINSVVGPAHDVVTRCFTYSDQMPSAAIASLSNDCGWNGHGVANLSEIYYDPNPAFTAHFHVHGYNALPFRVRLSNSLAPFWYYVPVRMTSVKTAVVAGAGSIFMAAPGFIAVGNTVDEAMSTQPDSPIAEAITQFLAGAARYTAPGVSIPINNPALRVASASDITIYTGPKTSRVASASVTYRGPTTDATFTVRIAFQMSLASSGDWVINAIGPDTNVDLSHGGS